METLDNREQFGNIITKLSQSCTENNFIFEFLKVSLPSFANFLQWMRKSTQVRFPRDRIEHVKSFGKYCRARGFASGREDFDAERSKESKDPRPDERNPRKKSWRNMWKHRMGGTSLSTLDQRLRDYNPFEEGYLSIASISMLFSLEIRRDYLWFLSKLYMLAWQRLLSYKGNTYWFWVLVLKVVGQVWENQIRG